MMYDIAALQHMYGADFTTNSGNTTYTWNPLNGNTVVNGLTTITPGGNRIFLTIWDGGGIDTYDLSAYSSNLSVNLAPGSYSVFSVDAAGRPEPVRRRLRRARQRVQRAAVPGQCRAR